MKGEFEMSLMGELTFFLEHQINQSTNRTFISQEKYIKELKRRLDSKSAKTLVPQRVRPRVLKLMHLEKTWMKICIGI